MSGLNFLYLNPRKELVHVQTEQKLKVGLVSVDAKLTIIGRATHVKALFDDADNLRQVPLIIEAAHNARKRTKTVLVALHNNKGIVYPSAP